MKIYKWQEYEALARERLGSWKGLSYFTERVLDRCVYPGSRDQLAWMAAWTDKLRFKRMAALRGFRVPKVLSVWKEADKGLIAQWLRDNQGRDDFVVKPTHLSGHVWLPSQKEPEDPATWFDMRHGPAVRLFDDTTQLCKPWYDFSPCVFAEERVWGPTDWKFYVIGGRVRCCIVCWGRGKGPLKFELLDRDGRPAKVDLHAPHSCRHPLPGQTPAHYREGVARAEELAACIGGPAKQFVRLDFFHDSDRGGWLACELDWAPGHYGIRRVSPESVDLAWGRYWLENYYA